LLPSAKCTRPLFQGRTDCGGRPSGWHDIVTCQHLVSLYYATYAVERFLWLRLMCVRCWSASGYYNSLIRIPEQCVFYKYASGHIGAIWCQAAYADTTGRAHRSYVRSSLISSSSPNHTGILVRCVCCTASLLQLRRGTESWPQNLLS